MTCPSRTLAAIGLLLALAACNPPDGESDSEQTLPAGPTLADYERAERMLAPNTRSLVLDQIQAQYWQSDDSLLYRKTAAGGYAYVLANPVTGDKRELLDTARLGEALAAETGEAVAATDLQLSRLRLDGESLAFRFAGDDYVLDLSDYSLTRYDPDPADEFLSPDGARALFIRDHNLWLRDTASNALTQLTFDGEPDYGYGTNNAGWIRDDSPVALWSPDSNSIATFRHDGRNVGEMYLYSTEVGHPRLDAWKYPLPGDEDIFMIERLVIHLAPEPRIVRLAMPPDPHRSTTSDHVADSDGTFLDVEWSEDGSQLAFVSSSRDHKVAQLRIADTDTGQVRDVHREEVATYYESGFNAQNWRVLPERNEFLWFSEQDNWGHLYLYDLTTGALKRQITSGDWPVLQVLEVDAANAQIYFIGAGREPGDPYFHYLYRVDFDGSALVNLTPEPAHHRIDWSNSHDFFTDAFSTPVEPGAVVIRDRSGAEVLDLERPDIDALVESGWRPPQPFTVKARDQVTDLHGLLYRPGNFDPQRSYPVLNYVYPGPQIGSVSTRRFVPSRGDKQAIAELGFIVVEVDAMGTPERSKSFHDAYYGDMGDNGLPDQIATIRQLAAERPWMDLDRVGIWGHSGGGFASTAGLLRYPDFYKVAVSSGGNHDNRNYEDDWGEKWQGLLVTYPESTPDGASGQGRIRTNYDNQANQLLADQLQGKLLLAHGMMDDNVHPSNTLLLVDALIEAEKDFDLVLFPNARHGFGNSRYFMLRRWNYFIEHLQQQAPNPDFRFADNIP